MQHYNSCIFDYCLDHFKHFNCYPIDMEIDTKGEDNPEDIILLSFEHMMQSLTEYQKQVIEGSYNV